MGLETGEENKDNGQNLDTKALLEALRKQQETVNFLQQRLEKYEAEKSQSPQIVEMLANALGSLNAKQRQDEIDFDEGISEDQIPVDDYVEEGVRFCAPFVGYVISDDRRKGMIVKLPYNKKSIFFEHAATRITQTGKYNNTHPFSVYVSKSKKEIEWLRSHSLYNITFYETSTEAVNADAAKAARLSVIMNSIKDYELPDLMSVAKQYGVPITEDASIMKHNLAFVILEKEMNAEIEQQRKRHEENAKHSLLLREK